MTNTKQPLRVLYIDDRPGVFPEVVDQKPGQSTLDFAQELVGGLIECVHVPSLGVDVWVNEEGLYQPGFFVNALASIIARGDQANAYPLVGPAFIASVDHEGNMTSVPAGILSQIVGEVGPAVLTSDQVAAWRNETATV